MTFAASSQGLAAEDLRAILGVTSALAAPFDLRTMLDEVVAAAKQVLKAERGSVWLHDPAADELVLEVASGLKPVRVPAGAGLVGTCARTREIINVPDCYADPRFDPSVDRSSGYRTRCMLTLPLVDHKDVLVGVMQVLNKAGGAFDADDEALARALAAQCAVALQRARMTEAVIEGEKMRHALELAREVQMSTLPTTMPAVRDYDVCGTFRPADLTGGDTFDLSMVDGRLLAVLADATGHGIGPALSITQMHAMLRMAFRLGADLDTAFAQVNDQLALTLPDDRFITAFIGLLDPATHRMRFHSAGQGPILHFRAAANGCERYKPTSFPLGAMPLTSRRQAVALDFAPGDILALVSDGIFEYANAAGEEFGEARVRDVLRQHRSGPAAVLLAALLDAVLAFAGAAPQEDDMTVVLIRREAKAADRRGDHGTFERSFASIEAMVAFTAGVFAARGWDRRLLPIVDLAVEELFTNMVKYSPMGVADVRVELAEVDGGVEVTLTDYGVEPFDVSRAPDVDVTLPIERRKPGGLGLHLVRRMAESVVYEYSEETRESRTTVRITGKRGSVAGGEDARN